MRWLILCVGLVACDAAGGNTDPSSTNEETAGTTISTDPTGVRPLADVVSVSISGEPGAYQFAVGIRSDETGCEQYADWWEVLGADGQLVYRRVLTHSHPTEQPFVRVGGPVSVAADQTLLVRAHLNPTGFGGATLTGSVATGFVPGPADPNYAADLATVQPLPDGCLF